MITTFSAKLVAAVTIVSSVGVSSIPIRRFAEEYFRQINFWSQKAKSNRFKPEMTA
jgi:hypothetical protein